MVTYCHDFKPYQFPLCLILNSNLSNEVEILKSLKEIFGNEISNVKE